MAAQTNSPSGWVGWAYFAAFMMILLGVLQGLVGLAGIFKDDYFVVTKNHLLAFDFTTWGWINLVLGIIILLAGMELLRGATWARVVAILLAISSFVANMGFVNAYPIWSITMMVVDVFVVFALTVHGAELKQVE